MINDALIERIKQATHHNDHTGAVKLLAVAMKEERSSKILDKIDEIHDLLGHLPEGLESFRREIQKELIRKIQLTDLSANDITKLMQAF